MYSSVHKTTQPTRKQMGILELGTFTFKGVLICGVIFSVGFSLSCLSEMSQNGRYQVVQRSEVCYYNPQNGAKGSLWVLDTRTGHLHRETF